MLRFNLLSIIPLRFWENWAQSVFWRQIGPHAFFGGELGPGRWGPGRLGPGKFGPCRLGPIKCFGGKLGSRIFLVANWAPEYFWRQIGPQQIGPRKKVGRKLGPKKMLVRQFGPLEILAPKVFAWQIVGMTKLYSKCLMHKYSYTNTLIHKYPYISNPNIYIGEYICQLKLYIGIGYILPTIGEHVLVQFIFWYSIYSRKFTYI